jgi:hypothetical protein
MLAAHLLFLASIEGLDGSVSSFQDLDHYQHRQLSLVGKLPMVYARKTVAFYATVEIGSAGHRARVMLDTGSSDAWVHSKFFKSSGSCNHTGQAFVLTYERGEVTGEMVEVSVTGVPENSTKPERK